MTYKNPDMNNWNMWKNIYLTNINVNIQKVNDGHGKLGHYKQFPMEYYNAE